MKELRSIRLADVQGVYGGAEGELWELIMGEQIHVGGFASSMDLAEKAAIAAGSSGVDLCCCSGAGMRFLVRFRKVARMQGVDATPKVLELGRQRCQQEGLADRISFVEADVCTSGLPSASVDFVWGEDAWCYVVDKPALIHEAARLVKPGGTVAFTDWVEGPAPLSPVEAERYLRFMKFPSILGLGEYRGLLERERLRVTVAEHTTRFAPSVELYLAMLGQQLTYDALKIIGFDQQLFQGLAAELAFVHELARAGKVSQALFVARRG